MILGIIPARGGSKGIPRKNLISLNGIPLIQYTIREALNSHLDDVIISTDDSEIAKYHRTIFRPPDLAQDDTPTLPVIQHAIKAYEAIYARTVDAVMVLQPTSPLRLAYDIDMAISAYYQYGNPSVVSVCEGIHPVKSYDSDGNPFLDQVPYDKHTHKCLTRNGAIFIASRELIDSGRLVSDKPLLYQMPKIRSIDIDDYEDLAIAEAILKKGELQ